MLAGPIHNGDLKLTKICKGHAFELHFLNSIKDGIEEMWGIRSSYCKVFNRKEYYSSARLGFIEIDVSIEVTRESADTWYQLIAFECKSQKRPVDVNALERFKIQVDQIAGKNIKAFVVSRSGFTAGSLNYAKANGIGLINVTDYGFEHIAECQYVIEPLEYDPGVLVEALEGIGPHGNSRTLIHYGSDVRLEFFAAYCLNASPAWYRSTGWLKNEIQCEPYEAGPLEFHVATVDDFHECQCPKDIGV